MASKTFLANGERVTVRTRKSQCPSGIAGACWIDPGPDVTVVVAGKTFESIGSLMYRKDGNVAFSVGMVKGLWERYNTLDKECTVPHRPFSYKSEPFAFNHLCDYIKSQLEKTRFVP